MYVPSNTLKLALLRVFTEAGARAGDGLGFPEIARKWQRTGLRDSDLRDAVNEMLESGDLRSTQRDGVLGFALSATAQRGFERPEGELRLAIVGGGSAAASARD